MKEINDSYEHFSGDDAIKTVAKALRDTIGLKADIYRIGGDEFVCISESSVLPYISQFKDTIYFINNEKLYNLSVSIGYSRFHEKYSKSIDDIICRADEKMYKDKRGKITPAVIYFERKRYKGKTADYHKIGQKRSEIGGTFGKNGGRI